MRTRLLPTIAAAAVVAGCGVDGATDRDAVPEPEPTTPASHPTAAPWPAYPTDDYTFTLRVTCYCPDGGAPITVTVADGKVTEAVFARHGWGHPVGAPAPAWMQVTINDVIDAANDTKADTVTVRWPNGQDYPTSVWVDLDKNMADEERGYTIRNVQPL